jgi:hypothetical protein
VRRVGSLLTCFSVFFALGSMGKAVAADPTVLTQPAIPTADGALLKGTVNPNGTPTTVCQFSLGVGNNDSNLGNRPCLEGQVITGTEPVEVSALVTGLAQGNPAGTNVQRYTFRLHAKSDGEMISGAPRSFNPSAPPAITNDTIIEVYSNGVSIKSEVNPNAATTSLSIEFGATTDYGSVVSVPGPVVSPPFGVQNRTMFVYGMTPGTTYHVRIVGTNARGTTHGPDHVITTFPLDPVLTDPCSNAAVRKQTGAAKLAHCRAYELVSAAEGGGYDVASNLVLGQAPLPAYPDAGDRFLYTLSAGKLPGIAGSPTTFGDDPYVATRGPGAWSTSYVGIPAAGTPSDAPFASSLSQADASLSAFAFAGDDLCSPCFGDGSSGIPLRLPSGELIQGMAGSIPSSDPIVAGQVAKPLSADGSRFIFGSTTQLEPDGNSGEVSIYSRDLKADTTKVVSKTPAGATMTGPGIAALDVSADGSRVLIGRQLSSDANDNPRYHLYMNVDGTGTIDLTPATADGVLYAGMSIDGTKVYFASEDRFASDADASADLYRADVSADDATLTKVSTGSEGAGETDACTPEGAWNDYGAGPDCGIVVIAGGGGVAPQAGSVFFLSPEQLDGASSGMAGKPNLYLSVPGSEPKFVATLETANPAVLHALADAEARNTADFQVTTSGADAVFVSRSVLADDPTDNRLQVYRYHADGEALDCVSCIPTGALATGDATLASHGLSLAEDGRVFFTSADQLVLRDTNRRLDAYEWDEGTLELISSGAGLTDSALASVSSDGRDVFFFTRETFAPQDKNGATMKVYTAREGGGFPYQPPPVPCQASDECHGPGTKVAPPPDIGTYKGEGGNAASVATVPKRCRKAFVKRRGKCVRRVRVNQRKQRQARRKNNG